MEEGIKTISHHANVARKNLPLLAERIRFRRKPDVLAHSYASLSRSHVALAMYDYFVTGSLCNFQHHFHVATRLKVASLAVDSYQPWTVGRAIFYALLSSNPELIAATAHLAPQSFIRHRNDPQRPEFSTYLWQLALRADHERLQEKVTLRRRTERQLLLSPSDDFFSLLLRNDKAGLEAIITQHARQPSDDPLIKDFLSFQGTLEAKICWLKGIAVNIDSPLLPMAVLPVAPLDHYSEPYEFLNPRYVPPTLGVLEMLGYWYRDRERPTVLTPSPAESF